MITVKLVRIISGFVLTEHPHLALMYGGHHPNIDYSYRANLTRRFNGQRQSLRLNFSGKVRPAEIQQTHTSRLSWAGISPESWPGGEEESWWSGGHLGSGMLCHRWQTLTTDMSAPPRPLIGHQPSSRPLIGCQGPVSPLTSDMNDWLFIAV